MKKTLLLFSLIFLICCCKSNTFSSSEKVAAVYLTVMPYTISPFKMNEVMIQFEDEQTCSQLRIYEEFEEIVSRINKLKRITYTRYPPKYIKYTTVWIGLQLVNEKKRLSIGITDDGVIKIGNHFYAKDDELFAIIFRQKIHPRILETIPKDSIWGKFLINK